MTTLDRVDDPRPPPQQFNPSSSRNLPANGENASGDYLSPRVVAREAAKVLAELDLDVRPAAVRTLVTRFIREGHTTTTDLRSWVIGYADPTGETAVRNVMRSSP